LTVVPQDGDVAYICETLPGNVSHVWRTEDAGLHWAALPPILTTIARPVCYLHTDQNDPRTVLVTLSARPAEPMPAENSFALVDGAAQWRPTSNFIVAVASWQGTYYAIKGSSDGGTHLYTSTNLNTWHSIESSAWKQSLSASRPAFTPRELWVQPKTGMLQVLLGANSAAGQLWTSTDHGARWQQIAFPWWLPTGGVHTIVLVYVEPAVGRDPFAVCAAVDTDTSIPATQTTGVYNFYCSHDEGQTWSLRVTRVSWGAGAVPLFLFSGPDISEFSILPDGSLVAWEVTTIYRLSIDNTSIPNETVLGSIPQPPDPNNIPGGMIGITAHGAVFWQPFSSRTVYVASYSL
jgi:hypothetical protein